MFEEGKAEKSDQELDQQAASCLDGVFPDGGRMTEEQSAKFLEYVEQGIEAEWKAFWESLAVEAGVAERERPPPVPDDHPCCPMCRERGAAAAGFQFIPEKGAETLWRLPLCAFSPPSKNTSTIARHFHPLFYPDNWKCAALDTIRDLARKVEVGNFDQHVAILPWRGEAPSWDYLVVSYYKHRGQTEGLWVLSGRTMQPATYGDVEEFIRDHRDYDAECVYRECEQEVEAQWGSKENGG